MRYQVFCEELYHKDTGNYRSYGIQGVDTSGKVVVRISDISTDECAVAGLAARCTCGGLAPEQLHDVVQDFL